MNDRKYEWILAFNRAGRKPADDAPRQARKAYSACLASALVRALGAALRPWFPELAPRADELGEVIRPRTSKRYKKLGLTYCTPELGLGLGVTIKTIDFRDPRFGQYKWSFARRNDELRLEAMDYHDRQPWSTLVAVIFLPAGACDDGGNVRPGPSSFGSAVRYFRRRAARQDPRDASDRFERIFIGLYSEDPAWSGECEFYDVMNTPPNRGRPKEESLLNYWKMAKVIRDTYDLRNRPPFLWTPRVP